MKSNRNRFDFRTAYIDLLINLLTGTVVLFILTTLLIAPITKKNEGIKKNAEYIISMEWPSNVDCDVDLWVRDPMNNVVSYKIKEGGGMYYERDDLGQRQSKVRVSGREVLVDPDNKEYITFRGAFEGEYVVNIHTYSCKKPNSDKGLDLGSPIQLPVKVEVIKLNPDLITVKTIDLVMKEVDEEQTAFRFMMNDMKHIYRFWYDFISIRTDNKDLR